MPKFKGAPKKKICYFCSLDIFDTGMPISTFKLVEHFSRLPDFQVSVILPGDGELCQRIRRIGIAPRIIPFKRLPSPRRLGAFLAFWLSYPMAFVRVALYLRKNAIDIVHFSDIIDAPFYPCALLARAKAVAHLRHCIENKAARLLFACMATLFTHKVVCISEAVKRFSGIRSMRAEIVYNTGPDPTLFDPRKKARAPAAFPLEGDVVLSIGKFVRVKGHEHFVRIAHAIERRRPGLCRFIIVGSAPAGRDEYFREVTALIASLGLGSVVTILAPLPYEQIPALLARSAVLVHAPNWQEGLGGVVLEAMAMEVPVVAFNAGGIAECFTHGISGFLVAQFDIAAAAARIIDLLDNAELRRKTGIEARAEVLAKFSYIRHFSAIESIYRTFS